MQYNIAIAKSSQLDEYTVLSYYCLPAQKLADNITLCDKPFRRGICMTTPATGMGPFILYACT